MYQRVLWCTWQSRHKTGGQYADYRQTGAVQLEVAIGLPLFSIRVARLKRQKLAIKSEKLARN